MTPARRTTASPAGPVPYGALLGRALHALWNGSCLGLLALLVAVRAFRYSAWSATPAVDRLLQDLMVLEQQSFLWPWAYSTLKGQELLVALALVVVAAHRRLFAALVTRERGVWRFTPVAVSITCAAMLWVHYLFDLNPTVALACGTSLVLVRLARLLPLPSIAQAVLWGMFFVFWVVVARDPMDRLTMVVWALVLAGTQRFVAPRVGARELVLLRVLAVIPMNLLPATLPLFVPVHGGTYLGDGLAYGFCEVPGRPTLYATVPVCNSIWADYEDCRDGRVVEYDPETAMQVAAHAFFSPRFYGRLELAECLEDEVQVAVQGAVIGGRNILQSALAFPIADPSRFNPLVAGEGLGITIAYDGVHRALFYTGEFTHRFVRLDRDTGRLDDVGGAALARRWTQPVALRQFSGSSIAYTHSIHPGRNRIYIAEWMQGRRAHAVDLTTLQVVDRYEVSSGGAAGLTVDPDRDRLFVSSLWGLEVFDLATGKLVARRRMGLGSRSVIVDAERNRLYLGSTVEGKIRVLDRDSFEVIGQMAIGIGSRFPHLSANGRYLFASSVAAHYRWDAAALVEPQ